MRKNKLQSEVINVEITERMETFLSVKRYRWQLQALPRLLIRRLYLQFNPYLGIVDLKFTPDISPASQDIVGQAGTPKRRQK